MLGVKLFLARTKITSEGETAPPAEGKGQVEKADSLLITILSSCTGTTPIIPVFIRISFAFDFSLFSHFHSPVFLLSSIRTVTIL